MSQFFNDSIFWIEVDKIKPNPYQPRKEFDPIALQALSDSIRQYGVLQALVVTRKEVVKEDGGLATEYELIAGERRLRASKLAGLREVPCLIKTGEENDLLKLELAIIENVQREDLNAVDRAKAFQRLVDEFGFKHGQIAEKVGKSREYVTNTLRLLSLPEYILQALGEGKITEGHARPLMMLTDRPQEQETLFKEITFKKLTVREAEAIARKIAQDRVRKKEYTADPELAELEEKFTESLGTRVHIERRENGGKLSIDFFSNDDLRQILDLLKNNKGGATPNLMERFIASQKQQQGASPAPASASTTPVHVALTSETGPIPTTTAMQQITEISETIVPTISAPIAPVVPTVEVNETPVQVATAVVNETSPIEQVPVDDRTKQEVQEDEGEEDLYSVKNFVV